MPQIVACHLNIILVGKSTSRGKPRFFKGSKMGIVKASIFQETNGYGKTFFIGECEALPIRTNIAELEGELVEFLGDTRQDVIEQIISALKSRGMSGKLRIV